MNETVIEAHGLVKTFGSKTAVNQLDITVAKGEIFGLLGHNGAGKSTTIDCILGTQKIDAGSVSLLGQDPLTNRQTLFQRVGVQFQQSAFQTGLKVSEICAITHSLYSNPINWQEWIATFRLEDKRHTQISDLSGGERQKLCILLAMMGNPDVLFLDELTPGLDPVARREIWHTLRKLNQAGVTIFLTSHDMNEVEHLCDRILLLADGKEQISGTIQEVIHASGQQNMEDAFLTLIGEEWK
ncbi:ABC transporter ATP-binding protein [Shouchella sp. JSM 1781072]|uniref:ABC transporter ATP-binding protein n=1 Tax=Bacillaceae TaxID=186817 RepID=UPI000C080632|nr:ABC transporter ATP-binding protein [Bacillus sp. Marseille-P3800]